METEKKGRHEPLGNKLWWTYSAIIVLVILLVLGCIGLARADEVIVEGGPSYHERQTCYLWNHKCAGYETKEHLISGYVRGGYFKDVGRSLKIGISGFNLGKASVDAIAADDEQCVKQNGTNSPNVCGPTQRYLSETSAYGGSLSLRFERWSMFIEGGPTYLKRKFKISTQKPGEQVHERQDLMDTNKNEFWGMGQFIGFGYKPKNLSVGFYLYNDNIGGNWPSGFGKVYVLALGKSVRF